MTRSEEEQQRIDTIVATTLWALRSMGVLPEDPAEIMELTTKIREATIADRGKNGQALEQPF